MNRASSLTKAGFKHVSHVIFDMDGLLLDTETLYTKATQNIVNKYGKTYDWSVKVQIMGLTGNEAAKKIVALLDLPIAWEQYVQLAQEQYLELMPHCQLMPDTERIYKRVISDIAKKHGKVYTPDIVAKVVGTVETESARIAVTEMKLPMSPQQFLVQFKTLSHRFFHTVPFMPGAEKLVKHLHSKKVPIAVATSSGKDSYELKTAKHKEFFALFDHTVTGGSDPEVENGKPSPDIFLVCASRFPDKPDAGKCLVFEDAPNGVTAAVGAGMQVVMVPDKQTAEDLCKQATLKIDSLEEMKPELFGLPAYGNSS